MRRQYPATIEMGDQQAQLQLVRGAKVQCRDAARGIQRAAHAMGDAAPLVIHQAHADPAEAPDVVRVLSADLLGRGVGLVEENVDQVGVVGAAHMVEHYPRAAGLGLLLGRRGTVRAARFCAGASCTERRRHRGAVVVADVPAVLGHIAQGGVAPGIGTGERDRLGLVAGKRLEQALGGVLRRRVGADPDLQHAVDIGVVRAEQWVKRGVGVIGHIAADPAVIVVVGLLVQAIEIQCAIGVQLVFLRRIEFGDIGPGIPRHTLGLAEGLERQGIHHLLLENPAHAIQLGAFDAL